MIIRIRIRNSGPEARGLRTVYDDGMEKTRILDVRGLFDLLLDAMGPTHWWPAETRFEIALGAVLVQNASWTNAEAALDALRAADLLRPAAIVDLPDAELEAMVRPAGFYRAKSRYLKALCAWLTTLPGEGPDFPQRVAGRSDDDLRRDLLAVPGIGGETADDILLYVFDRPAFVADTYARRLFEALGVADLPKSYEGFRRRVMPHILTDEWSIADLKEFHGLIDEHGKTCRTPDDWRRSVVAGCRLDLP